MHSLGLLCLLLLLSQSCTRPVTCAFYVWTRSCLFDDAISFLFFRLSSPRFAAAGSFISYDLCYEVIVILPSTRLCTCRLLLPIAVRPSAVTPIRLLDAAFCSLLHSGFRDAPSRYRREASYVQELFVDFFANFLPHLLENVIFYRTNHGASFVHALIFFSVAVCVLFPALAPLSEVTSGDSFCRQVWFLTKGLFPSSSFDLFDFMYLFAFCRLPKPCNEGSCIATAPSRFVTPLLILTHCRSRFPQCHPISAQDFQCTRSSEEGSLPARHRPAISPALYLHCAHSELHSLQHLGMVKVGVESSYLLRQR
ncbi:hypothetical protein TNIN_209751 [Trichonephila inaurata madagascariensis]|uniref:Secreted protein n=1 Tax=Trichonephila inaurata madagascariensis TaxID=2747483 RepID=A0A8X6XC25_9ARAC|nr:hypothetical protein TNIN_209751 [Trichonephila inaurata madagascariensis]